MIKTFLISAAGNEITYSGSMNPVEAQAYLTQILIEMGRKEARVEKDKEPPQTSQDSK